ncbi:laminin domain protein, putative [Rhizoctonia solani AG-3 Rhs1AP]|uniref:Laminin domain protein, putative n=1 Tax=Rhizoctonia solani AG-3 Rhs1AP TaxID=1086054 RepID=A0A0A1UJG1_9AGAM|nr:laminin domain protein, putative [Rhizoctonia solani AG-3 Rhs1AP]
MIDGLDVLSSPPDLPPYLRNIHDLKPITGPPTDDELLAIQAVARAAHNASNIPGMYDASLSMKLAEHMFSVQMARYRNKHSLGIFREKIVYIPPVLPEHIPVKLESVTESPSDDQLTKVHTALRSYEQFSNVPSMFDPRVSMELSQHMFELQMSRYMQHVSQTPLVLHPVEPAQSPTRPPSSIAPSRQETVTPESVEEESSVGSPTINAGTGAKTPTPGAQEQETTRLGSDPALSSALQESNHLVERLGDTMDNISKVLAGIQHSLIRGLKSGREHCEDYQTDALTNKRGELPVMCGLPALRFKWKGSWIMADMSDAQLARYLQFYDIGGYLIDDGELPTIKGGMTAAAHDLLWWYFRSRLH